MFSTWFASLKRFGSELLQKAQKWIIAKTKPANSSQLLGTTADLWRSKSELVAENALLRQQLIVLKRSVKQPKLTGRDRWLMVLLSSKLAHWKQALLIIQPDTLLRWHRELFKWVWRRKSKHTGGKPVGADWLIRPANTEIYAIKQPTNRSDASHSKLGVTQLGRWLAPLLLVKAQSVSSDSSPDAVAWY